MNNKKNSNRSDKEISRFTLLKNKIVEELKYNLKDYLNAIRSFKLKDDFEKKMVYAYFLFIFLACSTYMAIYLLNV